MNMISHSCFNWLANWSNQCASFSPKRQTQQLAQGNLYFFLGELVALRLEERECCWRGLESVGERIVRLRLK